MNSFQLELETATASSLNPIDDWLKYGPGGFLAVKPEFVAMAGAESSGDVNLGLILGQAHYWLTPPGCRSGGRPRGAVWIDGAWWVSTTYRRLADEIGLSAGQVENAIKKLKAIGHLVTRRGSNGTLLKITGAAADVAADSPGVLVPVTFVTSLGGTQALVLSRVCHWFGAGRNGECRAQIVRHGRRWIAKTHQGLASEIGVSWQQVRYAVGALVERGLVITNVFKFKGRPTLHLQLIPSAVARILQPT